MPTTNLNITVIERRLISQAEAAKYCSLPAKKFPMICRVAPIDLDGKKLFDKKQIDRWLDELNSGAFDSDDEVLGRL